MLGNRCNDNQLVYKAEVYTREDKRGAKIYVGISRTKFNDKLGNHNVSFKHKQAKNNTTLAKEV